MTRSFHEIESPFEPGRFTQHVPGPDQLPAQGPHAARAPIHARAGRPPLPASASLPERSSPFRGGSTCVPGRFPNPPAIARRSLRSHLLLNAQWPIGTPTAMAPTAPAQPTDGKTNRPVDNHDLDAGAPSRPLYDPWILVSSARAVTRTTSGNREHLLHRRSDGFELPRASPDSKPTSSGFSPFRQS
jgi:hypothetical protein